MIARQSWLARVIASPPPVETTTEEPGLQRQGFQVLALPRFRRREIKKKKLPLGPRIRAARRAYGRRAKMPLAGPGMRAGDRAPRCQVFLSHYDAADMTGQATTAL